MKKNNVAVKETTAVTVSTNEKGYDSNVSNDDLILPRIDLLQSMSPSVISKENEAGHLINNITKEDLGSPVIIPVFLSKTWIRWRPRNEGGGIVWRSTDPNDPRVIEESRWNGDQKPLATAYLNFLCILEGDDMPIIASFANTSYQAGRKLFTLTKMTKGPLYACKYALSSKSKTNTMGTFFIFDVARVGATTEEEQRKAAELRDLFADKTISFENDTSSTDAEDSDEF